VKVRRSVDLEEWEHLETAVEETESVFAGHIFKRMRDSRRKG
jgi:Rod binding domain-containing protein